MTPTQAFTQVTGLSLEDGIRKAVEGGYSFGGKIENVGLGEGMYSIQDDFVLVKRKEVFIDVADVVIYEIPFSEILLDPLFFKALGVALGWDKGKTYTFTNPARRQGMVTRKGPIEFDVPEHTVTRTSRAYPDRWKKMQHRFLDALQEGVNN